MTNALVYSMVCREPSFAFNQNYLNTLHSIQTAQELSDGQLPIKVFLSPLSALDKAGELDVRRCPGVEVIEFRDAVDPRLNARYLEGGFAQYLDHRWRNALWTFELFPSVDRILYLDGDTRFKQDPRLLFGRYPDPTKVYARKDNTDDITQALHLDGGMNDGQFILSRAEYERLSPGFDEAMVAGINQLLRLGDQLLDENQRFRLLWLVVQYNVRRELLKREIELVEFDRRDVMLSTEPVQWHQAEGCAPPFILHHYFNGNAPRYLPRSFWLPSMAAPIGELCPGCGLLTSLPDSHLASR